MARSLGQTNVTSSDGHDSGCPHGVLNGANGLPSDLIMVNRTWCAHLDGDG